MQAHTCKPAMGYSFAAGTIDGPGEFTFTQGEFYCVYYMYACTWKQQDQIWLTFFFF